MSNPRDSPPGPNSRHVIPRDPPDNQSQSLTSYIGNGGIVYAPFMAMMLLFQLLFKAFFTVFGNTRHLVSNYFVLSREQNDVLKEMPVEQERQQHELQQLQKMQVHQRDRVEDLKRRIDKLEAKQREREAMKQ